MKTSPSEVPSRRSGRRLKRTLFGLVIAASSLLAATMVVLAIFGDRWANAYAQTAAKDLSRSLGRPVQLGAVSLSVLRGRAEIRDISIGAAADEPKGAPALRLGRASVDVGMLRTLLSLGFYPYVEEVRASDLQLQVVKRADGTLNWQQIGRGETAPEPAPASDALDPRVRRTRVGQAVLERAAIVLVDATAAQKTARISDLGLQLEDVGYSLGATMDLQAALLAPRRNLSLHAEIGALDEGRALPAIDALHLALSPVQLAPLSPFLAALLDPSSVPERAELRADVDITTEDAKKSRARGSVLLSQVVLPEGKPFDAKLAFDASTDPAAGEVDLRSGTLQVGPMQIAAQAQLSNLNSAAPTFRRVSLRSTSLSFEALRAIYPGFDEQTAPARLTGPFALSAQGGGDAKAQAADLELSLTEARIAVGDTLDKPAGTPLLVRAHVTSGGDKLSFAPLRVQLADFAVLATGEIAQQEGQAASIDVKLETPDPSVGGLLRLLPNVARAVPSGAPLDGSLTLRGKLTGTAERYTADAALALSSPSVQAPSVQLAGGGDATLSMRSAGKGSEGKLKVDFTELTALYADVVQKPGGTPLRVDATLSQQGNGQKLDLSTTLASLVMRATATLRGSAPSQAFTASVEIPSCDVRGVAKLLPGFDAASIGDVQLTASLEAEGVTGKPASLRLEVPRFKATAGRSDLSGSLTARNAARPEVALTARSANLDLSDFLPRTSDSKREESDADQGLLTQITGVADVEVKRGRAADVTFEDLRAKLRLANGVATAEQLEVRVFNGSFSGSGSVFPLVAGRGAYQLKGGLEGVQVQSALAQLAGVQDMLTGQLSGRVDLNTRDLTVQALQQTLTGVLQGTVVDGAYLPLHGYGALTEQLGGAVSLAPVKRALEQARSRLGIAPGKSWELKDLATFVRFDRGAAVLAKPLTAKTPQGDIRLEGKLGLAASDLSGTFALAPDALAALTDGKLKLEQPLPVPFRVQGPLSRPSLQFTSLESVLQPLLAAYAREQGVRQLEKGAEKVLEKTGVKERAERAKDELSRRLGGRAP